MSKPLRIYGVRDIATAWGLSPERVRQLVRTRLIEPDLVHIGSGSRSSEYMTCYWYAIPERNGFTDILREVMEDNE